MNAKEMFEELDFIQSYTFFPEPNKRYHSIDYIFKSKEDIIKISFYLEDKNWGINLSTSYKLATGFVISIEIFLAIQQQMRELEWI